MTIVLICLAIIAALFVLLFTIYFFNLDMKFIAVVYTFLNNRFDKMKKDTKI